MIGLIFFYTRFIFKIFCGLIMVVILTRMFGFFSIIVITSTILWLYFFIKNNKAEYKKIMEANKVNKELKNDMKEEGDIIDIISHLNIFPDEDYQKYMDTYKASNELEKDIKEERVSMNVISSLNKKLNALPDKKGALQLKRLATIISSFEEIISYQEDKNKATLLEYERAVEQVDEAVHDNLEHYFLVIKSIEPFDSKLMYEASVYSQDDKKELSEEWSNLCLKQRNRAKDILVQNEQAITQLYIFLTDVVNISFKKIPDYSMQKALDNLTQQTRQTEQYSDEVLLSPYE